MPENTIVSDLSDKASETVQKAKATISDKASQLGNKAVDSIDASRSSAANMLDSAA